MFRVSPIIRSTSNCNCSFWYGSYHVSEQQPSASVAYVYRTHHQQYIKLWLQLLVQVISRVRATSFRQRGLCLSHPSSGLHQTVTAAFGTGHITCQSNMLPPAWPMSIAPIIRSTSNCNRSFWYRSYHVSKQQASASVAYVYRTHHQDYIKL